METTQLISQEWDYLSGQFTAEETDFMTQFLGGNTNYSCFPSNVVSANSMCFSQGSSTANTANSANSGFFFPDQATNIDSLSGPFCSGEDAKFSPQCLDNNLSTAINYESIDHEKLCLELGKLVHASGNHLQGKREYEMMMVSEPSSEEDRSKNMENSAKRFRSSNTSMSNLCRKSRARNGPATDSQSIYARRRRERINERLRMLQTLVPNGTKVDISTMLEEAVQYVKFLQLQIKVLSSDDMWMYAPLAYNGINIGLDLTFSSPTNQMKT